MWNSAQYSTWTQFWISAWSLAYQQDPVLTSQSPEIRGPLRGKGPPKIAGKNLLTEPQNLSIITIRCSVSFSLCCVSVTFKCDLSNLLYGRTYILQYQVVSWPQMITPYASMLLIRM